MPEQPIAATFICKDCRVLVEVTEGERRWYADRGWTLPRHCAACRARRRRDERDQPEADRP